MGKSYGQADFINSFLPSPHPISFIYLFIYLFLIFFKTSLLKYNCFNHLF